MKVFLSVLSLMFIGAKLTGYVAWSWALVLIPVYIMAVLWVVALALSAWAFYALSKIDISEKKNSWR